MTIVPDGVLPYGMTPANTCCFTGHRVLPADRESEIAATTEHVLNVLIYAGYRYFLCGGALGFDTLAARVVLGMREKNPEIRLILALPCRDQTGNWLKLPPDQATEALRAYQKIKGEADAICFVNDFYFDGCMRERNRFMIERSSFCIGYYNGYPKSGAGQTWRMAEKAGLKLYNVYDMLGRSGAGDRAN